MWMKKKKKRLPDAWAQRVAETTRTRTTSQLLPDPDGPMGHGCPAACLPVQLEATLLINQMDCETCTCVTEYMVVLSSGSQCEARDWNWS